MTTPAAPPARPPSPNGSPACRTSSPPTTRKPTSRGSSGSPRDAAVHRRDLRDHRRQRRVRDRTREIADRLAADHPDVVRAIHHDVNRGYGGALRSGFEASRYELLAFTDGDRQFRIADIARLTERLAASDHPDVVVGYRIKRADPLIRIVYARTYKLANRIFFGLRVRDVDCACKLFRREALEGVRVGIGRGLLLGGAAGQDRGAGALDRRGRHPPYARTAGSPTGARPSVIGRAVKDFWMLRLRLWANAGRARRRGRPILGG